MAGRCRVGSRQPGAAMRRRARVRPPDCAFAGKPLFSGAVLPTSRARLAPLAALAALAAAGCRGGGPAAPRPRPPPAVTAAPVEVRDVPVEVHAPVDLRPIAQADVGAKTIGYLDAVLVDRGDRVKRGQLV